jgi:hypothetical protein
MLSSNHITIAHLSEFFIYYTYFITELQLELSPYISHICIKTCRIVVRPTVCLLCSSIP